MRVPEKLAGLAGVLGGAFLCSAQAFGMAALPYHKPDVKPVARDYSVYQPRKDTLNFQNHYQRLRQCDPLYDRKMQILHDHGFDFTVRVHDYVGGGERRLHNPYYSWERNVMPFITRLSYPDERHFLLNVLDEDLGPLRNYYFEPWETEAERAVLQYSFLDAFLMKLAHMLNKDAVKHKATAADAGLGPEERAAAQALYDEIGVVVKKIADVFGGERSIPVHPSRIPLPDCA